MAALRILMFFFLLCNLGVAEERDNSFTDNGKNPKTELSESLQYPVTWNSYNIIATATAVVIVAAGVMTLLAFISPLITYKICYLLGSCDDGFFSYVDRSIGSDTVNPRKKQQKRSLEYLGPILQALASAYEKYGSPEIKKNSKMSAS